MPTSYATLFPVKLSNFDGRFQINWTHENPCQLLGPEVHYVVFVVVFIQMLMLMVIIMIMLEKFNISKLIRRPSSEPFFSG